MDKAFIKKEARCYFIPFLLGDNSTSRHLSRTLFRKYGIVSFILDTKGSFSDIFSLSYKSIKLSPSNDSSIILLQLLDIAKEFPFTMPILIPCSKEFEKFTTLYKQEIEPVFILSNKDEILTSSPLKIIPS